MIIQALVENTSKNPILASQDGLSIYIETEKHKVLFDMGADSVFIENAEKMGIDLSEIDIAVISHGHYDHGGGLKDFLAINTKAKIYISNQGFGDYYTIRNGKEIYAGLDKSLIDNNRIVFVKADYRINDEIRLYSDIETCDIMKVQNKNLLQKVNDKFVDDAFNHEQNLAIREGDNTILLTGCAHKGIINIVNHILQKEKNLNIVIGGFHLKNISDSSFVKREVAKEFEKLGCRFYTCHCTGVDHYDILKEELKDRISYLSTGSDIII